MKYQILCLMVHMIVLHSSHMNSEHRMSAQEKIVNDALHEKMFDAVAGNDLARLESIFVQNEALDINERYYTATGGALRAGPNNTDVQLLLGLVPLETLNKQEWTTLVLAILNKNFDILKFLIQNNVKLDLRVQNGKTALMYAVQNQWPERVRLLVLAGANDTLKNDKHKNYTALDYANSWKKPFPFIRKIIKENKSLRSNYFEPIMNELKEYFPTVLIDIITSYAYDPLPEELFLMNDQQLVPTTCCTIQ